MDRGEVSLEDVGSVEALFGGRAGARAKSAHHSALVMGQCVSVFVVFAGKPFLIVFTGQDWAFLRSLGLMCKHVSFQVFEDFAAIRMRASTFLPTLLI